MKNQNQVIFKDKNGVSITKKHLNDCGEAMSKIFVDVNLDKLVHYMKQGKNTRENIMHDYGGVNEYNSSDKEIPLIRKANKICGRK